MDDGFYELRQGEVLRSWCRPTHKPCALQWRLDIRGSVAPPRGKVGFDPPRGLPPRYPRPGALEDRFDVVPVGVYDEGGIVVGIVALAQAWGPVITPPAGKGGGVEVSHRLGIRSNECEVERAGRLPLDERQVLGVLRPQDHGGSPRLRRSGHVGHLSSQWLQSRSVELQGAREVGDLDDYVIEKGGRTSHKLMILLERLRIHPGYPRQGGLVPASRRRASPNSSSSERRQREVLRTPFWRSSHSGDSRKFALKEFCEVRHDGVLRSWQSPGPLPTSAGERRFSTGNIPHRISQSLNAQSNHLPGRK